MTDPAGVIDRSSSVPFHYQLRKLLEQQIETGQWPQGDRLPSEPFLSEYYSVSRRPCARRSMPSRSRV